MGLILPTQFGLQDLVKVEQPRLFGELTGCQAGFQPSPVTLTTVAPELLVLFAKPQALTGSLKAQEAHVGVTRELHSIFLLLMVLLASREPLHVSDTDTVVTIAIWISAIILIVPEVIQKTSSQVSETQH